VDEDARHLLDRAVSVVVELVLPAESVAVSW
jgi:hypothetical protein